MDIVNEVLQKAAKKAESFKPITVEKHLEVEYDVGNLVTFDINELDTKRLRSSKNDYLLDLTRDNTQLLLNKIWELPTERVEEAVVAVLPKPTYVLPRAKPVPKPKEPTKWEKFAKEKGITKTKKSKLQWDEVLQKWIPRFGYKRASADKQKDWVIEVPGNADPYEDQFAKKSAEKQERVSKNELQRMRNIAVAKKVKVPRTGILPSDKMASQELHKAASIAKLSTASGGKFQPNLPKEKPARNIKQLTPVAPVRKRKQPILTLADEKKNNIDIIDNIINKRPKVDIEAAVNRELHREDNMRAEERANTKPKAGRGGKKKAHSGGKKGKGASKPLAKSGGKGKGTPSKGNRKLKGGRKRR